MENEPRFLVTQHSGSHASRSFHRGLMKDVSNLDIMSANHGATINQGRCVTFTSSRPTQMAVQAYSWGSSILGESSLLHEAGQWKESPFDADTCLRFSSVNSWDLFSLPFCVTRTAASRDKLRLFCRNVSQQQGIGGLYSSPVTRASMGVSERQKCR